MPEQSPVLRVEDLNVGYFSEKRTVHAVWDVSFEIGPGQTLGVVGESGSGKSTMAFAIMGYCGRNGRITGGKIFFRGEDLRLKMGSEMRQILGNRIAMVYQDPQKALNPSIRVGEQVLEVLENHTSLTKKAAIARTVEMLEAVHMPDPEGVMQAYPHQLSGGMQQRVVIASALICNPDLLIMDEPTSGLDVTIEAVILDLVKELKERFQSSILFITHNLGVIARTADRIAVMYAGEIVEVGTVTSIFGQPAHPYTLDLLNCVPRLGHHHRAYPLRSIPGRMARPEESSDGCVYQPRCSIARDLCSYSRPVLREETVGRFTACHYPEAIGKRSLGESEVPGVQEPVDQYQPDPILAVKDLRKVYDERQRKYLIFGPRVGIQVRAVEGASANLGAKETVALVGESGCGKTTFARCIIGLEEPTSGSIAFRGKDVASLAKRRPLPTRRALQMVFQNPDASLNPAHRVVDIVGRPLKIFHRADRKHVRPKVLELLQLVKLDASHLDRYPAELSGGEKQRVSIARAFAGEPEIVVCDEAVSSLDVSVQASILNLLAELQREQNSSYFFISHDLGVVQYIADRILVMYLGQVVEAGDVEEVFAPPYHPYTEALLSAIPVPDPFVKQQGIRLKGSVPRSSELVSSCPFHTRCPRILGDVCRTVRPAWQVATRTHGIMCHIPIEDLRHVPSVLRSDTAGEVQGSARTEPHR